MFKNQATPRFFTKNVLLNSELVGGNQTFACFFHRLSVGKIEFFISYFMILWLYVSKSRTADFSLPASLPVPARGGSSNCTQELVCVYGSVQ